MSRPLCALGRELLPHLLGHLALSKRARIIDTLATCARTEDESAYSSWTTHACLLVCAVPAPGQRHPVRFGGPDPVGDDETRLTACGRWWWRIAAETSLERVTGREPRRRRAGLHDRGGDLRPWPSRVWRTNLRRWSTEGVWQ
jgi:hypothetical protein